MEDVGEKMTTKITVYAICGKNVEVTQLNKLGEHRSILVNAGETRDFYVFDTQDLLIKEIQPLGSYTNVMPAEIQGSEEQ